MYRKNIDDYSSSLTNFLVMGIAINGALCSTFSIVEGRFQGRLVWLVPLFFGVLLASYIEKRKIESK